MMDSRVRILPAVARSALGHEAAGDKMVRRWATMPRSHCLSPRAMHATLSDHMHRAPRDWRDNTIAPKSASRKLRQTDAQARGLNKSPPRAAWRQAGGERDVVGRVKAMWSGGLSKTCTTA